jgi:hypothetical protein
MMKRLTVVLQTSDEERAVDEMRAWGDLGFCSLVASVVGDYGERLYEVRVGEVK